MMSKRILFVLMICVTSLCYSQLAYGQAIGSFSGTVTDKSGAAIAGAAITVTSQGTGVARNAQTDETGHYIVNYLPVGMYTIHVQFQGFQAAEAKDVRLQIDESRELDFSLSPSSVSATVEVSATAVAVEATNPSLGQVITAEQVTQLPLNGRDFVQLATLTPGTAQETNPNSFINGGASSEVSARGSFSLSVGGSRTNATDWILDGNDNNELTAGGIGILSSIDSIQEFKVLTYNYSAEFGFRAGPTVLVTTKSGGNQFHGSLFEFLRNKSLDAKSFFAPTAEKFNLNQFGGSLGGPIFKNKTFFFLDGEQKFQRKGITFTGLVPTDAQRTGDFTGVATLNNPNVPGTSFQCDAATGNPEPVNADGSQPAGVACNKIPGANPLNAPSMPNGLINPIGQALINLYPEPNTNGGSFNYVNSPVRKLDETKFDIRLDHNFTASDSAFARFSYDQAVSYVPGGAPGFAESNAFGSNQGIQNHGRNIALSETHIFSPTLVNQVNGGYNRIFNYITSQGTGTCASATIVPGGIPGANLNCDSSNVCPPGGVSCGLTSTQVSGYFSLGDRGFSPFIGGTNVFSIGDTLNIIRGKHDIKVGLSVRANQMNVKTNGFGDGFWITTGLWSGEPTADLLEGLSSLAIHDQTFKGAITGRRWKTFRPFVQDDWRVTSNLTVNLGFAWNLTTPVTEAADRQANFNFATGQFLIAGVNSDSRVGIEFDKRAVEPRIGLAWKPFGKDTTAVRAGYAIYHDTAWSQGAQGLWQNPPYYAESDRFAFGGACTFATAACAQPPFNLTPSAISFSDGFEIIAPPTDPLAFANSFTGTLNSQNPNFKSGTVQQFNVNVEHQVPGGIVLTVGYAGSRGTHILTFGNNLNVSTPLGCTGGSYTIGCGPGGTFVPSRYVGTNFQFNTIANITDTGRTNYNGLQIKAETKSSKHGVYALIGYSYSRTYDNGLTDGLGTGIGATYFPLPGWSKLDWALSQINLNHNFTASVIYDLPFGKGKRFGNGWSGPMNTVFGNWQLTLIEKLTSGFPVFVVDSANFNSGVNFQANGLSLIRPDIVGDPNKAGPVAANPGCTAPARIHTVQNWFNPCAFAFPAAGELGNANRSPVNGPNFINTDFSVIKQFALPWENMGLNFRAEFFNLFNHAQFGLPVNAGTGYADIASGNAFGAESFIVNNPRVIQFGLKLTF
ncbi:MAG TPA: carboxypeptidase-like regulatory domain-containing protein [Candidatus Acidoferrum sp.]|nr:carboxypeptidase-like regulatory domain-containing protein [Candidatus Acidoferrum sp.]